MNIDDDLNAPEPLGEARFRVRWAETEDARRDQEWTQFLRVLAAVCMLLAAVLMSGILLALVWMFFSWIFGITG